MESATKKGARELLRMGFKIVPLLGATEKGAKPGKSPHPGMFSEKDSLAGFEDQWNTGTIDTEKLLEFWDTHPNANIGILVQKDLIVVDADTPEAVEWCRKNLSTPIQTMTGKGMHFYYRANRKLAISTTLRKDKGIDIKAVSGYVVAPPSIHAKGPKQYNWIQEPVTTKDLPIIAAAEWQKIESFLKEAPKVKAKKEKEKIEVDLEGIFQYYGLEYDEYRKHQLCPFPDHDDHSPSHRVQRDAFHCSCGSGNGLNFIARMEGWNTIGDKLSGEAFKKAIEKAKEIDPELSTGFDKFQAEALEAIEDLNERYFFFEGTGSNNIMRIDGDKLTGLNVSTFKLYLANKKVGSKDASKVWMESPLRRAYRQIVFEPSGEVSPDAFNCFRGWAVKGEEGKCETILYHIKEVICGGNQTYYEYLIDWMCDFIQNPTSKTKTSIGIYGPQGTGKGMFTEILRKILGDYFILCSDSSQLTGRFNQHLQNKLLAFLDEAFIGQRGTSNKIKTLITSPTLNIEIKGGAAYQIDNYLRVIAASNHPDFLNIESTDRRWLILEVSSIHMQDGPYFEKLRKAIDGPECRAFFHLLRTKKIEKDLQQIPKTAAKEASILSSLEPLHEWWFNCLSAGEITYMEGGFLQDPVSADAWQDGGVETPTDALYKSWLEFSDQKRLSQYERRSKENLGRWLLQNVTDSFKKRVRTKDFSGRVYWIPPLESCQKDFEKRLKIGVSW